MKTLECQSRFDEELDHNSPAAFGARLTHAGWASLGTWRSWDLVEV